METAKRRGRPRGPVKPTRERGKPGPKPLHPDDHRDLWQCRIPGKLLRAADARIAALGSSRGEVLESILGAWVEAGK